jgi:hypothetical protein
MGDGARAGHVGAEFGISGRAGLRWWEVRGGHFRAGRFRCIPGFRRPYFRDAGLDKPRLGRSDRTRFGRTYPHGPRLRQPERWPSRPPA